MHAHIMHVRKHIRTYIRCICTHQSSMILKRIIAICCIFFFSFWVINFCLQCLTLYSVLVCVNNYYKIGLNKSSGIQKKKRISFRREALRQGNCEGHYHTAFIRPTYQSTHTLLMNWWAMFMRNHLPARQISNRCLLAYEPRWWSHTGHCSDSCIWKTGMSECSLIS